LNRPKGKAGGWDNKNKRVTCRAFCSPHLGSCLASSQNPHLRGCVLETPAKLHQQITCKRPDLSTFLRAAPEPPAHEGTAKQGKMPAPPGQAPGCPFYPCDVPGCLFCALVCIYLAKEELCCTLCFVGTRSKVRACVRRTVRVASSLPANLIPGLMIGFSALKSVSAVRS
jgi:hypothetical protein